MKNCLLPLLILLSCARAQGDELHVSTSEPVYVVAPGQWQVAMDRAPNRLFPFETFRITPPADRNEQCLVSIFDKDRPEFSDPAFLKKLLRGDCMPYVNSPDDLAKVEIKELTLAGGLGFYADFTDPDLVGKPVKKGSYKTATPVILSLGTRYLIKVTILCDEINGADYQDAIRMVQSIKIKKE